MSDRDLMTLGGDFVGAFRKIHDDQRHLRAVPLDAETTHHGSVRAGCFKRWSFQDLGLADGVGEHDTIALQVEPLVVGPLLGQMAEWGVVATARVLAVADGICPPGGRVEAEEGFSVEARELSVSAGEGQAAQGESAVQPSACHAERVGVEDDAGVGLLVEWDDDGAIGDVRTVIVLAQLQGGAYPRSHARGVRHATLLLLVFGLLPLLLIPRGHSLLGLICPVEQGACR